MASSTSPFRRRALPRLLWKADVGRIDFQRHSVLGDGFIHVSLSLKSGADVIVRAGVTGINLERHLELGDSFVRVSHFLKNVAEVVVGFVAEIDFKAIRYW